jgi:hypothetical protein
VLADPQRAREALPPEVPFTWVHVALLMALLLQILGVASSGRRLGQGA